MTGIRAVESSFQVIVSGHSEKLQKFVDACITRRTGVWSYEVEMEGITRRRHADQLRKRHYVPLMETEVIDMSDNREYLPQRFDECQNVDECLIAQPAIAIEPTKSEVAETEITVSTFQTSQSVIPSDDSVVNTAVTDPDDSVTSLGVSTPCPPPRRTSRLPKPPLRFYEQFDL